MQLSLVLRSGDRRFDFHTHRLSLDAAVSIGEVAAQDTFFFGGGMTA